MDVQAHVTYNTRSHGSSPVTTARPRAIRWGFRPERWQECGPRVRFSSSPSRAGRHLPLRARSSTGWAGGALRYDGGLEAHSCNRAAPKCPGPPVLPVSDGVVKQAMVFSRRHFVPNPVPFSRTGFRAKCKRPQSIHTRYDTLGRLVCTIDASADSSHGSWLASGVPDLAPAYSLGDNSTRTTYNALGDVASTEDQMGRTTVYVYDNLGRKTDMIQPDPATGRTFRRTQNCPLTQVLLRPRRQPHLHDRSQRPHYLDGLQRPEPGKVHRDAPGRLFRRHEQCHREHV